MEQSPYVGLAVVTANRDAFERLQDWSGTVIQVCFFHLAYAKESTDWMCTSQMIRDKGWLASIFDAVGSSGFTASGLGIPGLRHFIYKSRTHVQLVTPSWEEPYTETSEQKR